MALAFNVFEMFGTIDADNQKQMMPLTKQQAKLKNQPPCSAKLAAV